MKRKAHNFNGAVICIYSFRQHTAVTQRTEFEFCIKNDLNYARFIV